MSINFLKLFLKKKKKKKKNDLIFGLNQLNYIELAKQTY